MDEDNSNDVVLIENTEDEDSRPSTSSSESRPLMALFERLISNDTKSNTILTNTQILSILKKEFNIDITTLHELEIDIYINIVKKFLKDWPQWDAFDLVMNRLKKKGAHSEIKNILEKKYEHLKLYLMKMIETAQPLAKAASETADKQKIEEYENNDLVLEIYSTRKMLNSFIYNHPHPEENSLFNLVEFEPYTLNSTLPLSLKSLLHWYGVRLTISLPYFQYTRYTSHRLSHVLVNEAHGPRKLNKELDTSIHMKTTSLPKSDVTIKGLYWLLEKIIHQYKNKIEYAMLREIFDVIKSDLSIDSSTIEVPGTYKQRLNKYPYVRKLCTKVEAPQNPNSLYIEETIIPIQDWFIGKFVNLSSSIPLPLNFLSWLKFECEECKQSFKGSEFLTLLRYHFNTYHKDEPDWSCTNCEKSFTMVELTSLGWQHDC